MPSEISDELAEGKDCWYCDGPLLEGNPVSVGGLFLAHDKCRPTYGEDDEEENEERVRAELTGCSNCSCVGRKMPEIPGEYAFDDVENVKICVTEIGDVIVHYRGVGG